MNVLSLPGAPQVARVHPLATARALRGPFDYRLTPEQAEVRVGTLLRIPFGARRMLGVVVELAQGSELAPERLAAPDAVLPVHLPADLVELAGWIAAEYCSTPARALALMLAGAPRGARRRRDGARPASPASLAGGPPPALTGEQRAALEQVLAALAAGGSERPPGAGPPRLLLHGVTGSGKTEVYLRAVEATLASGRDALVLVPEIALTPQALARFEARLGPRVAVLHSGMPLSQRREQWWRLRTRQARVCVGPRSAVFAPLEDLGLVVIDEEHDGSYKQEGDPRYDARAVALRRARQHGAVLLCGTATPRPESVVSMRRLRLRERIDRRRLPEVEVLDMRGRHHPLHPRTRLALADVRRRSGKAIVLLNRRGWSSFLSCRACGRVWLCPGCDVSLVLHLRRGVIACHHCGHREPVPSRCAGCGSAALARHGAGTERLEHELRAALGDERFPIFRLDADAAAERAGATLARFGDAPAGVLVGTQVVAKGHDFPDVTLGVVLDADQTLRFPDFRAEERTFALLTQLAGRAGRGERGGTVLVQTLAPHARPIVHAAAHDADGFLAGELARREALGYPPFGSLIRIVCAAASARDAGELAASLRDGITVPGAAVLGPAPLHRLRGRERAQLVIKARAGARARAIAAVGAAVDALSAVASRRRVSVGVDVDPQ